MTNVLSPRRFRKRPDRAVPAYIVDDEQEHFLQLIDEDSFSEPDWAEAETGDASDEEDEEDEYIDEEDVHRPKQSRQPLKRPRAVGNPSSHGFVEQGRELTVVGEEELRQLPHFKPLPTFTDTDDYNAWAQTVIDSMATHNEDNLHPILSFIYPPWKAPEYNDDLIANNEKVSHTAGGSTKLLKDIPWLPRTIPGPRSGGSAGWQLAIYEMLGAHPKEIVKRIPPSDEVWGNTRRARESNTRNRKQMESLVRRRIDLFSKSRGRLCRLTGPKVNGGRLTKQISETLEGKTELQLYLNCAWNIDLNTRNMRQPNSRAPVPHRLYQPSYSAVFETYLREVNGLGMNLPVPSEHDMLAKYPALAGNIATSHNGGLNPEQLAKRRRLQVVRRGQMASQQRESGHDPTYNSFFPISGPTNHRGDPESEVLIGTEAFPSLHSSNSSDDVLWEIQWTQEHEDEWNSIPLGEANEDTRWLLNLQYGTPEASHLPRFPL